MPKKVTAGKVDVPPTKVNPMRRGEVQEQLRRRQDRWLRCRLEELVLLWSATGGAESQNVAPHLGLVLQVPKGVTENAGSGVDFGRDKAVVHPLTFAPRRNDSCSTEIGKMA